MDSNSVANNNSAAIAQSDVPYYDAYQERARKLMYEMVAMVKNYCSNTKRVISASVVSNARVQNNYEQVIEMCQRELRRKDISREERKYYAQMMADAAKEASESDREARAFQHEKTKHSHGMVWSLIGLGVAMLFIGGGAIARAS